MGNFYRWGNIWQEVLESDHEWERRERRSRDYDRHMAYVARSHRFDMGDERRACENKFGRFVKGQVCLRLFSKEVVMPLARLLIKEGFGKNDVYSVYDFMKNAWNDCGDNSGGLWISTRNGELAYGTRYLGSSVEILEVAQEDFRPIEYIAEYIEEDMEFLEYDGETICFYNRILSKNIMRKAQYGEINLAMGLIRDSELPTDEKERLTKEVNKHAERLREISFSNNIYTQRELTELRM